MSTDRFKAHVSAHVLFIKDKNVLMSLRKNITSDGLYGLVAGHLEGKETVTDAILREVKEEVGLDLDKNNIEIKTVCHSYSKHNEREFIQFYAICRDWEGEFVNEEPDKCGELKFFSIDNLPSNTVPYIRKAIREVMLGTTFYEDGWGE